MNSDKVIEIGAKVAVWIGMGLAAHVVNKAVDAALDRVCGEGEGEWSRVIAKSMVWGAGMEAARRWDVAGRWEDLADEIESDDADAVEAIEHVDAVEGRGAVKHTVTPSEVGETKVTNGYIQLRKNEAQAAFPELDKGSNPRTQAIVTTQKGESITADIIRYNRTNGEDRYDIRGAGVWAAEQGVKPGEQVTVYNTDAMQSLTERAQAAV